MIDINEDVEHDADHFEQIYREATAAIEGEQNGDYGGVNKIVDLTSCPLCFVEALLAIAAGLANGRSVRVAADHALADVCG